MHFQLASVALAGLAAAYPGILPGPEDITDIQERIHRRAISSETEDNCGFLGCDDVFDAQDQFVDVRPGSGHQFIPPSSTDLRGPCPGLNAAANHGFASRTGVFDFEDTVNGLFEAFAVGRDVTPVLFVFGVFNSGSVIDAKWSIGGPFKSTTLGLLAPGQGISNSHNKYEGDASTGRGDAFLHDGDSHSLNLDNYRHLITTATADGIDDFNFVKMRKHMAFAHNFTKTQNPYGFFSPFSFFVPPVAHQFVTAMFSNHSVETPGGVLPKHILNSFFSVKEYDNGTLEWVPGHDRIPDNWYRRPSSRPYGGAAVGGDLALDIIENPEIGDVGGNTGTTNSYVGLDLGNLTNGAYNSPNLLKGNNLQCFAMQALIGGVPNFALELAGAVGLLKNIISKSIDSKITELGCPQLNIDQSQLGKYPGWTTKQPLQPATPY